MTSFEMIQLFKEKFESEVENNSECSLKDLREDLYCHLTGLGFPDRKSESWKYTGVNPFIQKTQNTNEFIDQNSESIDFLYEENTIYIDVLNNNVRGPEEILSYVSIEKLNSEFLKVNSEKLESLIRDFEFNHGDALTLLNGVFFSDGYQIVFRNNKLNKQVNVCLIHRWNHSGNLQADVKKMDMHFLRYHLKLEAGVQAKIETVFENKSGYECNSNVVFQVDVEENSILKFVNLQNKNSFDKHYGRVHVNLHKSATFNSLSCHLGSKFHRQEIHIHHKGEGAESRIDGIFALNENQHHDLQTGIYHLKELGQSQQLIKGIVNDKSNLVFNGKIYIDQDSQKVNSNQLLKAIILGKSAQVNAKPDLEILADDVKASHGATVGSLDPEQIFYLVSRGLSLQIAEEMLSQAHLTEVINNHDLSNYSKQIVDKRINQICSKKYLQSSNGSDL